EPVNNGIGSDAFALIWDRKRLVGLNASGKSPAAWTVEHFSHYKSMPLLGWDSATIPGAVSAWVELSQKYGLLPFKELFEPAIKYAEKGFLVSPITAEMWKILVKMYKKKKFPEFYESFLPKDRPPYPGELFSNPAQARTLKLIAESAGDEFYKGEIARKIVNHSRNTGGLITMDDLANHEANWVELISIDYHNITLHEIPPNGQGLAALIALGILEKLDITKYEPDSPESLHLQIEAMKLAFSDAHHYISDSRTQEFDPSMLLKSDYLSQRAELINKNKAQTYNYGTPKQGDTVYLTTADEKGMMVSYIQSNYMGFGSGIVIPGTGITLQNRANGFNLIEGHPNQVGPNKRPYHTIIPAFVTKQGEPLISFGVMGGSMQPQGHAQMMIRIFLDGQNPQTAIDAPRWRLLNGRDVILESGFKNTIYEGLSKLGHIVSKDHFYKFGGAQLIYKLDDGYLGASDWRKDGQAVGF
ncbi:MAG: gamma-glutamyltransferase family protein, partial [Candidatus Lokiarchaeota archaeon]|nr:gamma-glutamyltransferase family protein [Candidatus Lokiarchaeota archaeon]